MVTRKKVGTSVYRSLIGCLFYLLATRPDAMYATSMLSRFMCAPNECHFRVAKRVLRYLKGIIDYKIPYRRNCEVNLKGFIDSDKAGSIDDMKSTIGSCFTLGSGMVS